MAGRESQGDNRGLENKGLVVSFPWYCAQLQRVVTVILKDGVKLKKLLSQVHIAGNWQKWESNSSPPDASFCVIDLKVTLLDRKSKEMVLGKLDEEYMAKVDTIYMHKKK